MDKGLFLAHLLVPRGRRLDLKPLPHEILNPQPRARYRVYGVEETGDGDGEGSEGIGRRKERWWEGERKREAAEGEVGRRRRRRVE